ncbi:tripartite tricarboxylate transporter substrate binding protein [Verticiella sediminum]|uniref:Tripartite tricarboxylate transporter substrate binding protein n=1 Tax=Verticiella sediminum TaxID=1247510 RepID=A0A556AYW4_9BURK|nr:tripartite tricarboxylate transporter substrate binding protein [Verticiella sediminum]TSH98133.1 tripartite tricarboxylate transporter substrate binding protein [Verticiella sediminum]
MSFNAARRFGAAALMAALGLVGVAHAAGDFPNKPIRLVIPFPAGGGTDTIGRIIGKGLQEAWGQNVIVDNVAGAGGQIGGSQVARAAPDGYTAMIGITSLIQQPPLYKNLPYDVFKDFQPVSIVAYSSDLVLVPSTSPFNSVDDIIKAAKERPGALSAGSYGAGTSSHLHVELFKLNNDVDVIHVPYKGAAPAMVDVMGGQLDVAFVDVTSAGPHLKSGKVKVLAVTGGSRVSIAPDAPTLKELGQPGYDANGWFALLLPANTPKPILDKYSQEVMRIVKSPEMTERLTALSLRPGGTTPEEMQEAMVRDGKGWASIVERANVKID